MLLNVAYRPTVYEIGPWTKFTTTDKFTAFLSIFVYCFCKKDKCLRVHRIQWVEIISEATQIHNGLKYFLKQSAKGQLIS